MMSTRDVIHPRKTNNASESIKVVIIRRVAIPYIYREYRLIKARAINEFPPDLGAMATLA